MAGGWIKPPWRWDGTDRYPSEHAAAAAEAAAVAVQLQPFFVRIGGALLEETVGCCFSLGHVPYRGLYRNKKREDKKLDPRVADGACPMFSRILGYPAGSNPSEHHGHICPWLRCGGRWGGRTMGKFAHGCGSARVPEHKRFCCSGKGKWYFLEESWSGAFKAVPVQRFYCSGKAKW